MKNIKKYLLGIGSVSIYTFYIIFCYVLYITWWIFPIVLAIENSTWWLLLYYVVIPVGLWVSKKILKN